MAINVTLQNINTDLIKNAAQDAIDRALEAVGMQVENYAKMELEKPKAHADGTVRPNVDTGRLVNSITHTKENDTTVAIGTNVEYAAYVEVGTQKSDPYPFLRPAVEDHVEEYKQIIEDYLQNA